MVCGESTLFCVGARLLGAKYVGWLKKSLLGSVAEVISYGRSPFSEALSPFLLSPFLVTAWLTGLAKELGELQRT